MAAYRAVTILALCSIVGALLAASRVDAQGTTPLPLPSEPGGARPPVYTESPSPTAPVRIESPPVPAPSPTPAPIAAPPSAVTTESPAERKGQAPAEAPKAKTPQVTSFPELTNGVGNSETLLQE